MHAFQLTWYRTIWALPYVLTSITTALSTVWLHSCHLEDVCSGCILLVHNRRGTSSLIDSCHGLMPFSFVALFTIFNYLFNLCLCTYLLLYSAVKRVWQVGDTHSLNDGMKHCITKYLPWWIKLWLQNSFNYTPKIPSGTTIR